MTSYCVKIANDMNNKNNIINQNEHKICSAHIKIQDEYNKLLHEYKEVILDQKISVAKKTDNDNYKHVDDGKKNDHDNKSSIELNPDIIQKDNMTTYSDIPEDPKHVKYKDMYIPDSVYYGLGIENETYLLSDKTIRRSGNWIHSNRKRERYSVDYWTNFKKDDVEIAMQIIDKKKMYDIPVFINSHTFTRCDKNNEHKSLYTKLTEPNPKFDGETIHEIMMKHSQYYRDNYDIEFLHDGDTFEFTTLNFYNTTVSDCVKQLANYKHIFLQEVNRVFSKHGVLSNYYDKELKYPINYGFVNYVTNPRNISICNNSTYHINITLPTKLNSYGKIQDINTFTYIHSNAINAIQWIEPLILACYGSPDIFSVTNSRFSRGSQRLAISRYISIGSYDTDKMYEGKMLSNFEYDPILNDTCVQAQNQTLGNTGSNSPIQAPCILIPDRHIYQDSKTIDHWYKQYHNDSAYNSQKMIGFDINYHKHYNHGIELRIFDYFPEEYLTDVINILLLVCQKSLLKKIPSAIDDEIYQNQILNYIKSGYRGQSYSKYVKKLSTIFDIGSLDTGSLDTGTLDTGTLDTGTLDTGTLDTGTLDTVDLFQKVIDNLYHDLKNKPFLKQISPNMTQPIITNYNKRMFYINKNFLEKGSYHPMHRLGLIGNSFKENEKRLPIHPADFSKIPEKFRQYIFIDKGYGKYFGYQDDHLRPYVGGILDKSEIYNLCDVITTLKFTSSDYKMVPAGKMCWGWHHLIQNKNNVDIIIEKKLSAVSIEHMFNDGKYILEDNRLMAGYSSVMHAMQLKGITGYLIESHPRIAIISHGMVGMGAVDASLALGFKHIDVYTKRDPVHVNNKRNNVTYSQYPVSWVSTLKEYDIVVNCVLQDPLNPIIFLKKNDLKDRDRNLFIIDISCDIGMGFDFAILTTITDPIIKISDNVDFYGVDHSPSVFYNTVTQKISKIMIPYMCDIIEGKFEENIVIKNATDIRNGIVLNDMINKVQNR